MVVSGAEGAKIAEVLVLKSQICFVINKCRR